MKHPTKNITKKVAVVGCKHTTKDLILGLERYWLKIDHCITISPKKGIDQKVAGYMDLRPFLKSLSVGAFGMHGSSKPLPFGRGRSPINWSLIQDKKIFYTHLFQYLPGV